MHTDKMGNSRIGKSPDMTEIQPSKAMKANKRNICRRKNTNQINMRNNFNSQVGRYAEIAQLANDTIRIPFGQPVRDDTTVAAKELCRLPKHLRSHNNYTTAAAADAALISKQDRIVGVCSENYTSSAVVLCWAQVRFQICSR